MIFFIIKDRNIQIGVNMDIVAKFEKISYEQFLNDWTKENHSDKELEEIYQNLLLPKRATKGSAGYDFFAQEDMTIQPGQQILIPTGIHVKMNVGWVLMLFPRSSLGFKYRLQLNNTVGIIDSDYYNAKNEGHMFIKLYNDSKENKEVILKKGDAFAQGIFVPFGICEDDDASEERTGGMGSTNRKSE